MTEKKPRRIVVPPSGGMARGFIDRLKLILKLMGDKRVSPWLKLIPLGSLVYLISPIDFIMLVPGLNALDDAAVLWAGSTLFVELCPPDVVYEHKQSLSSNYDDTSGDVVDAESSDVSDNSK